MIYNICFKHILRSCRFMQSVYCFLLKSQHHLTLCYMYIFILYMHQKFLNMIFILSLYFSELNSFIFIHILLSWWLIERINLFLVCLGLLKSSWLINSKLWDYFINTHSCNKINWGIKNTCMHAIKRRHAIECSHIDIHSHILYLCYWYKHT